MSVQAILEKIRAAGIVAILRGFSETECDAIINALLAGGIRAVEVTLDTPGAFAAIAGLKRKYGDRMNIGAGTVMDVAAADKAMDAGADFLLSPVLFPAMIDACIKRERLAIPGAFTPTEIFSAYQAGAQLVKVFPIRTLGPSFIRDLKGPGPLGDVAVMAVGGVDLSNAAEYIRSGALALGIGSQLVNREWIQAGRLDMICQNATALVAEIARGRQ